MRNRRSCLGILELLFALSICTQEAISQPSVKEIVLKSPNHKVLFTFSLKRVDDFEASAAYNVKYLGEPVILDSRLGLRGNVNGFRNSDWYKDFTIIDTIRRSVDTTWINYFGERRTVRDRYQELTISLRSGRKQSPMQLIVRAYDEGIAFRYFIPEDISSQIIELENEATYFQLPTSTKAWYTPFAQRPSELRAIDNWDRDAEMPLTLELPNGKFACITQAAQVNYPRIKLKTVAPNILVSNLFGEITETSPFTTPWRLIMVADKPGQLLENNFITLNLNAPNALKQTDWITPGLVMREVTLSTDGAKRLVDFAVQQQIEYIHFDAGWYGHEYEVISDASKVNVDPRRNPKGDLDLHEAIRYAKQKGRKVMLYVNHRALEKQLDEILPLYKSWGVDGIKFGFVQTGSHHWTTWLHEAVRKAAAHQMVVDIHDEYRPTGYSRTYPNLLTQEGIHGNEEFPDATQNTILPFTRFIAGAADYTFCFNADKIRPGRSKTTNGHQLALPIVYFSPLQFVYWYGKPEDFPNMSDAEFWKGLPTVWDETRVIDGKPGEFVVIARRKQSTWYIGAITNNNARSVSIDFNFLISGKKYKATSFEDVKNVDNDGTTIVKREHSISAGSKLTFYLKASGGVSLKVVQQ